MLKIKKTNAILEILFHIPPQNFIKTFYIIVLRVITTAGPHLVDNRNVIFVPLFKLFKKNCL